MLDEVIADLVSRFCQHQRKSFALTNLLPGKVVDSTWADVEPAVLKYGTLLQPSQSVVKAEIHTLAATLEKQASISYHSMR